MQRTYRSYRIVVTSWGRLEPDGFRPEVRITNKFPEFLQTFKINETFSTKQDAESYALQVAQRWIDDNSGPQA